MGNNEPDNLILTETKKMATVIRKKVYTEELQWPLGDFGIPTHMECQLPFVLYKRQER